MPLMSDSKIYVWIKLKTNFLISKRVDFLMRQKDGANYVVLFQSLCLLSANTGGELADKIGEYTIPYTIEKIQGETKNWYSIDTIRVGLELFKKLGLTEVGKDGITRIVGFEEIVGSESGAAARMRKARQAEKLLTSKGEQKENIVHQEERGGENKSIEMRDVISNTRDTRILDNSPLKEINISSSADATAEKKIPMVSMWDDEEEISDEEVLSCLDKNALALVNKAKEDPDFSFKIFKDWFEVEGIKSKLNPSSWLTKVFDTVLKTGLFSKKRQEVLEETIRIAKTPWLDKND